MKLSGQEVMLTVCETECPFCEGRKERGHVFCGKCWEKLPEEIQKKVAYGLTHLSTALRAGITKLEAA